jgi:chromosome segregation ATPase
MIRTLETEIRRLQRELGEVEKNQALLRLQPCQGDLEIKKKDADLDELERRTKILNETVQDLTRKRRLLISPSTPRGIYDFPNSGNLVS